MTIGPDYLSHPEWGFNTRQIHAGYSGDPTTGAQTPPLYVTNSFHFPSAQSAADRFALKELGPIYSRLGNPTSEFLENRLANLEGGVGALLTSSGQGAITLALLTLARQGSNIVASNSIYGGTYNLLAHTLPRYGIETRFVTPGDYDSWQENTDENTVAYFGEVVPNPRGDILDIERIAQTAHENGIPLVVDSTVATPYLCRPIAWGADIVVHSATKYLGGHGSALAGVIVDAGNFDYAADGARARFPGFNTPDPSYHGLVYARDLGVGCPLGANLAFILKARVEGQRDLGFAVSPFTVFTLGLGVDTLSLRIERHVENARAVAEHLAGLRGKGQITEVRYSSLPDSPYRELAEKYLPRGAGAVLNFDLAGGYPAGRAFVDALELHSHVANIGDVRSLAIHPASTTHSQLSVEELAAQGIGAGTVRLSVGIEDSADIIADIDRALAAVAADATASA
ncbi:O-acetylhomoserine aminocarboxypropyltransferase/cysteine synthase family protein [Dermabacteraceae bacterium P13095]